MEIVSFSEKCKRQRETIRRDKKSRTRESEAIRARSDFLYPLWNLIRLIPFVSRIRVSRLVTRDQRGDRKRPEFYGRIAAAAAATSGGRKEIERDARRDEGKRGK